MMATLVGPATSEFAVVLAAGAAFVSAAWASAPAESRAATERVETILRVMLRLKTPWIPFEISSECRLMVPSGAIATKAGIRSDRLTLPGPDLLRGVLAGTDGPHYRSSSQSKATSHATK